MKYYATYSGNSLPTFRINLSVASSTVKKSSFFILEDGAEMRSWNVGKESPLYAK
jgi:hypothetical protein